VEATYKITKITKEENRRKKNFSVSDFVIFVIFVA